MTQINGEAARTCTPTFREKDKNHPLKIIAQSQYLREENRISSFRAISSAARHEEKRMREGREGYSAKSLLESRQTACSGIVLSSSAKCACMATRARWRANRSRRRRRPFLAFSGAQFPCIFPFCPACRPSRCPPARGDIPHARRRKSDRGSPPQLMPALPQLCPPEFRNLVFWRSRRASTEEDREGTWNDEGTYERRGRGR